MKKIVFVFCVIAFLSSVFSYGFCETKDELLFLNIPWGTTERDTSSAIENYFGAELKKVSKIYPNYEIKSSFNFTDPAHVFLPYYETDNIETESIYYSPADSKTVLTIAGWPVYNVEARYIQSGYIWKLFEAEYNFDLFKNDDSFTYKMIYDDLYEKLANKYGIPDKSYENGVQYYVMWYGANETVLILAHDDFIVESVRLNYGTTAVNNMFINYIEKKQQEEQQKHQELVDKIKEDNSGI